MKPIPMLAFVLTLSGGCVEHAAAPDERASALYPDEYASLVREWSAQYGGSVACESPEVIRVSLESLRGLATEPRATVVAAYDRAFNEVWLSDACLDEGAVLTHELAHWAVACAGGEPGHGDPAVWGPGGVLERAGGTLYAEER